MPDLLYASRVFSASHSAPEHPKKSHGDEPVEPLEADEISAFEREKPDEVERAALEEIEQIESGAKSEKSSVSFEELLDALGELELLDKGDEPEPVLTPHKRKLVELTPKRYSAARRAREAILRAGTPFTDDAIQRERKRLNQQDHRARQARKPLKPARWQIELCEPNKAAVLCRAQCLKVWLGKREPRQAQLLAGGKDANGVAKDLIRLWILYQRCVAALGYAPGATAFARHVGITPDQAKKRLAMLQSLESDGGPWFF